MTSTKSRVAVVPCTSYDESEVYAALRSAIDTLGGIHQFVSSDESILVKPNFLYPSDSSKAITTHPSVIRAILRILQDNGCLHVMVGDSPANGSSQAALERLSLKEADLFGAQIAAMDTPVLFEFNQGRAARKFHFAKEVLEADAIIGVCKMKTHMLERITGGVKNMYGLIGGSHKASGHVSFPTANSFAMMLTDIHRATPQRLHIMDGIVAMEGNGPSSGSPIRMGVILVSSDPVALDSVFCDLIHLPPEFVPTNVQGQMSGIGTFQMENIDILLVSANKDGSFTAQEITPDELQTRFGKKDFDVQRNSGSHSFLAFWDKIAGGYKKPVIAKDQCIRCGICVDHCPINGGAVHFDNGRDKAPLYDYKKCIRCYCCQELCPQHAISVKRFSL